VTPLESLRALGPGDEAPAAAKERVLAAVLLGVQASAAAATAASTSAAAAKVSGYVTPPASATGTRLVPVATSKLAALAVGALLLGGVGGAALYGTLRPASVKLVYVDRPVLLPLAQRPAPRAREAALPVASALPPTSPRSAKATPATNTDTSELARERALLDLARKSSAQGDAASALQTAELHRSQFPKGRLAEEREALAIRALSTLGRSVEARERAQAFRAAYPNSFLAGIVEPAASAP
jgi:hypothetical protein